MRRVLEQPDLMRTALGYLGWWFDVVLSFSIAFAVVYGAVLLAERLIPASPGGRPRVRVVPAVFLGALAGFPLFFDRFVSVVAGGLRDRAGNAVSTAYTDDVLMRVSLFIDNWILAAVTGLWFLGMFAALARTALGVVSLVRIARRLPRHPDADSAAMAMAGTGRAVVRVGAAGSPVASFGILSPCIVVPADFTVRYSPDEQRAMLLHECGHIANRDTAKLIGLALLGAVFWFDPFIRHAARRIRGGMELVCDWTVVNRHGVDPVLYAELIVKASASSASARNALAPGFSDAFRGIALRLGHVLRDGALFVPPRVSRAGAVVLLALLACSLAGAAAAYVRLPEPEAITLESLSRHSPEMNFTSCEVRHGVLATYTFVTGEPKNPPKR